MLKILRFDREVVRGIGADPEELAPRDRERFWYAAIAHARVDSAEAVAEAERLVGPLKALGYVVGASPSAVPPPPPPKGPVKPPAGHPAGEEKPGKKKKKP